MHGREMHVCCLSRVLGGDELLRRSLVLKASSDTQISPSGNDGQSSKHMGITPSMSVRRISKYLPVVADEMGALCCCKVSGLQALSSSLTSMI